jgi:hypothetical protein
MSTTSNAAEQASASELNLFCTKEGDAFRVYLRPAWVPRYLRQCLDENGEAYPVQLDFDDLDEHMTRHGAGYEKRPTRLGGVELTARGDAATHLAVWLSTAFASGVRPSTRPSSGG